jgi:USP6 N-terminal-like protein
MAPSPAPNEDPDNYYIRATYAALDVSGVKGDGYEDGQELTRARLGSGHGVLPSPFAPTPDTAERLHKEMDWAKGDLGEKEKELLAMVDRYVSSFNSHNVY